MLKNKTWIEISKDNLYSNINSIRKILKENCKLICVVKANAYGHDLGQVSKLVKDKTDLFVVDSLNEALVIRKQSIQKPVIILGYTPESNLKVAIENNISFVIYSHSILEKIIKLNCKNKAKVQIKIETGTNRQGLTIKDAIKLAKSIQKNKEKIILEGIYTHFADIEDTLKPTFAMLQLKRFKHAKKVFDKKIGKLSYYHCAASAGTILYPKTHFNAIRLGIALYGLWPSKEVQINESHINKNRINLKPVLSWKSIVAQIKYIKKGESVSYGRTWFADKDSKIAIIPVGYYDGIDRKLSNSGKVLIRGQFAKIIGRVAMDMIMVDISEIKKVKVEDEVVIIGKQGKQYLSADDIANKLGTISYEVVCRINPLIPRIVV